jgi:predicted RNA-binding protein YlqC (UPF0109 family)
MNRNSTTPAADIALNLLGRIVRELTFHHDALKIVAEPLGRVQIIYLQTHKADMGRVIGGQGAHRIAMCSLVELIGQRYSTELRLENMEPELGQVERFKPFQPAKWDKETRQSVIQLLKDICQAVFMYETRVEITDSDKTPNSYFQVIVSRQENMQRAAKVSEALKVLFNAIGKRHGRILLIDLVSDAELERLKKSGTVK